MNKLLMTLILAALAVGVIRAEQQGSGVRGQGSEKQGAGTGDQVLGQDANPQPPTPKPSSSVAKPQPPTPNPSLPLSELEQTKLALIRSRRERANLEFQIIQQRIAELRIQDAALAAEESRLVVEAAKAHGIDPAAYQLDAQAQNLVPKPAPKK